MNARLYLWQRGTAALMAPLVLVHLAVIFYATRQGLSAADILGRTRGSVAWMLFYGAFVLAAAIHASIGLRTILIEWLSIRGRAADIADALIGLGLAILGFRAIFALVAG